MKHGQRRNYVRGGGGKLFCSQYDSNFIFVGHCYMYTLLSQVPNDLHFTLLNLFTLIIFGE